MWFTWNSATTVNMGRGNMSDGLNVSKKINREDANRVLLFVVIPSYNPPFKIYGSRSFPL